MSSSHGTYLVANNKGGSSAAVMQDPVLLFLKEQSALDQQKKIIALYDEIRPFALRLLARAGSVGRSSEDIIQESFLRLVRHLLAKNKEDNLRGWLFRVAHNLAMDVHRDLDRDTSDDYEEREHQMQESVDPALNPEQLYLQAEQKKRLNNAIQQLTPQQRNCILLRAEGVALSRHRDGAGHQHGASGHARATQPDTIGEVL